MGNRKRDGVHRILTADLVNKGKLGQIAIGFTQKIVEEIIGSPEDTSVDKEPTEIWKYDAFELVFVRVTPDDRILEMINFNYPSVRRGKKFLLEIIHWVGWLPNRYTTIDEFTAHAVHEQLIFLKDLSLTFPDSQIAFLIGERKASVILGVSSRL